MSKKLVAYFSASGVTARTAKALAEAFLTRFTARAADVELDEGRLKQVAGGFKGGLAYLDKCVAVS